MAEEEAGTGHVGGRTADVARRTVHSRRRRGREGGGPNVGPSRCSNPKHVVVFFFGRFSFVSLFRCLFFPFCSAPVAG